jgi:hypothetical protein
MKRRHINRPSPPLFNPPNIPVEEMWWALAGERPIEDQAVYIKRSDIDTHGLVTSTHLYGGELLSGNIDLELLTDLELRAEEADAPMVAAIASGMGVSPLDEPYDESYHSSFLPNDDEICARMREAIRADSSISHYADIIAIAARGGTVSLGSGCG